MTPPVPVRKFLADALERVVWTFVETFAGAVAIAAIAGRLDLPVVYAAAIAGAAAVAAVVKALAASRLGTLGTASTLPADLTPTAPAPPPIVITSTYDPNAVQAGPPANSDDAELGLDQPIDPAPPPAPGTSSPPSPRSSPPVEALGHVDPPDVPPPPTRTALGARAERDKAAAEARATKAKTPAKQATPAKRPAKKAATPTKKATAKKASSTRKRSR